jgi:hypothetical protein
MTTKLLYIIEIPIKYTLYTFLTYYIKCIVIFFVDGVRNMTIYRLILCICDVIVESYNSLFSN